MSNPRSKKPAFHLAVAFFLGVVPSWLYNVPLKESHREWLFGRDDASFDCDARQHFPGSPDGENVPLNEVDIGAFQRDGVVILRDAIPEEWLYSYRLFLEHLFRHPSRWDVLYSRLVANFYGAQKSIFIHQSSECGSRVGSESPAAWIAAQLFASFSDPTEEVRMRVMEPTEALLNYKDVESHTAWHRDDVYMSYYQHAAQEGQNKSDPVVIRLWIPLMDAPADRFSFLALNNSIHSQLERREKGLEILGTNFKFHDDKLEGNTEISSHVIGTEGYRAGDVLVFAGDTPHFAQGFNCSSVGCARLIFSYALDGKAVYDGRNKATLLPLHSEQEQGRPLHGTQFPLIYPKREMQQQEWSVPMTPTYGDVAASIWHAILGATKSMVGLDLHKVMALNKVVAKASIDDDWVTPRMDVSSGVIDLTTSNSDH